ncbi:MAG: cystathionine beta-synthase, partial [Winogradskyella sp.]|nr:cystathionine beta-synthase [Winogradskyella sp.]
HVRRRETIAMTPADCLVALKALIHHKPVESDNKLVEANKTSVLNSINKITETTTKALVASSGLSIQYAILMGLIHDAIENHQ